MREYIVRRKNTRGGKKSGKYRAGRFGGRERKKGKSREIMKQGEEERDNRKEC